MITSGTGMKSHFRLFAAFTLLSFLLSSCGTYRGSLYTQGNTGSSATNSKNFIHDQTICILPTPEGTNLKFDSGINDVEIDCDISRYIHSRIKDDFRDCVLVEDEKSNQSCDVYLYPSQRLTAESNKMSYYLDLRAKDVATGKIIYAEKTSSVRYYEKSKPAFMFFSTLLFPPVLGGLLYAIRTNSIASDNFETAKGMINYAVNENLSRFDKVELKEKK